MSSLHAERGVRSFPSVSSPGSRKSIQHVFHRRQDRSHVRYGDASMTIKCQSTVPDGGNGDNKNSGIGRLLKTVQGALPVVGLLSRLTSAEGGVGNDDCAYPEYCRMVYEAAPDGFQIALADLQSKYGDSAQRRYVLLVLWMVKEGCGIVSDKLIVDSARRVRVSQDIEFEMERFLGEYKEKTSKYTYISDIPKGPIQDQASLAVDAIARLVLPIQDGDAIEEADASLVEDVVVGGMLGYEGEDFRQCVRTSIGTRQERAKKFT
ncbi:hypothetical protein M9435_001610 [Picochlorum sp. BPE23]|nr:hypothetical protein M9435_001610 [Picochlorum sp. BPE23]